MENYKFESNDFEFAQINSSINDAKFDTKPIGYFKDAMIRFRKSHAAIGGFVVIVLIVLFAIITPLISSHSVSESDSYFAFQQPYNSTLANIGICDGTYDSSLGNREYGYLNGIGIGKEDGARYVADPFLNTDEGDEAAPTAAGMASEFNPIRSFSHSGNTYDAKVMSYYEVGFRNLSVTYPVYQSILQYEEEKGMQMLYPIVNENNVVSSIKTYFPHLVANYWYETTDTRDIVGTDGRTIRELESDDEIQDNYLRNSVGKVSFYSRTGTGTQSYSGGTVIGNFVVGESYTVNYRIQTRLKTDANGSYETSYGSDTFTLSLKDYGGSEVASYDYSGSTISGLNPNSYYFADYFVSVPTIAALNASTNNTYLYNEGYTVSRSFEVLSVYDKDGNDTGWYDNRNMTIRVFYWDYYTFATGKEVSFLFGTDSLGRDIATRLASGIGLSLILAVSTFVVNFVIGGLYGAIEGYYGGLADLIMERVSDILANIPFVVLASIVNIRLISTGQMSTFGALLFTFCLTGWLGPAYRVRTQFYRFKNSEYVLAARTLGASDARIMWKHIFPNSLGTIITSSVLTIPGTIFTESSLSYLSIINFNSGDITSLGTLLSNGQAYLTTYPHIIIPPAITIALLMISFNLFGNGLRDAFNPSLRGVEE